MKHAGEYRNPEITHTILEKIRQASKKEVRLMEVCGSHTMSIFRNGIRQLLPDTITLLSGPGCPVCVTSQWEIDSFIALSQIENVIIATFGDLMRVPGTGTSLQKQKADGRDIRVVYSTFDAINIARKNPDKKVVFLGIGFETTAPTVAASILTAQKMGLDNYFVYSAHKLVPPMLFALMGDDKVCIDGFMLPGHVSVIIGVEAYRPFFNQFCIPSVVVGFEPADILYGVFLMIDQLEKNRPQLENAYRRAVTSQGNLKARNLLDNVFYVWDASWRGLGKISGSGLKIRNEFSAFDAQKVFSLNVSGSKEPEGCACGDVLRGYIAPPECVLYKKVCSPVSPVGPCMVSGEGTCAAYYRYHG
jgi:hydrogenase expression/formation protein HypD